MKAPSLGLAGLVRMSGCSCFPAKLRARAFAMARACHRSRFTSRSLLLLARSEPPHITKSTHAPRPNMSESDEEADLKRALAMSLGHHSTGEEDEEDLAQAIALSLQESEQQVGPKSPVGISNRVTTQVEQSDEASTAVGASLSNSDAFSRGLGGMDRKAMEEERLARQKKRKHISSPEQPVKRLTPASDGTEKQKNKIAAQSSPSVVLQYPRGAIKRTFAHAYPRTNDISIDELLQTPSIHMAVISSFMWDADWLHKKLDPIKVKQIWVMNAKGKDVQKRWLQEMKDTGVPNLTLHFPPMHGMIQSMHSKFLLLFGKKKLRFAVPTANMTCIDWGVANDWQPGVMENSVFLIDLPRLADGVSADHAKLTKFGKELIYFLEQQELPRKVIDGVLNFDFSETAHLAFVHSIGGSHDPTTAHPTGLPGLAAAVRGLNLGNVNNLEIDYAASSIGAVNDNLLQQLHMAARGKDFDANTQPAGVREYFRIYFPTRETVERSMGGPDCGGIISLRSLDYHAPTFPRECMRDYDSTRRGMLSHNKLLFARGCKEDGGPLAWVYVGSANLSESAWGGQKVGKSGGLGKLNIRNWECGVIVAVPEERLARIEEVGDGGTVLPEMGVFEEIVEIPFHYPGTVFGKRRPWFRAR
ncbi:hypothetical protein IAQ61_007814 [Plenodomus lingam]|uniref:uncharacterized protein n=1 Tax=Leptosphaeria maculans TaxID=5022 RepID=UPI00331F2954|nr:hypothetical protein IAQ61_007814 [Plenodomus lingam]